MAKSKKKTPQRPRLRFLLPLLAFTGAFLLYPGNIFYLDLFAYHPELHNGKSIKEVAVPEEVPYVVSPQPFLNSSAQGLYITDTETATPLYKKNEHMQRLPASTTKVMTALTASDVFTPEDVLTVKRVIDDGQTAKLLAGEQFTFENLLYAMLVNSANDAAFAIADNYPGGYSAFIIAMNKKAEELGMKNSAFRNPAGLDEQGQITTAFDLSVAARKLTENSQLKKIVGTKDITISDVDYKHFHRIYTINELLGQIPGIAGLKTGYTELAGQNLITLYKYQGHSFIIVVLKSSDRFLDTRSAIGWIQGNVRYIK